jgi:hypothetical protein
MPDARPVPFPTIFRMEKDDSNPTHIREPDPAPQAATPQSQRPELLSA